MKVVWNTCDKELCGEIKSVDENYFKVHLKASISHYVLEKLM